MAEDATLISSAVLKGIICWSQEGCSLTGTTLTARVPWDTKTQLSVELFANAYDCSERRLEHMDQAIRLFLAETSRTKSRLPVDSKTLHVFPRSTSGVSESHFCYDTFETPDVQLCMRSVVIDLAEYVFAKPTERKWVVDLVCHMIPTLACGHADQLPPLNKALDTDLRRPNIKAHGSQRCGVDCTLYECGKPLLLPKQM